MKDISVSVIYRCLINDLRENSKSQKPASDFCSAEKHHVILQDGCAVYLDHAWLRFHALHLC